MASPTSARILPNQLPNNSSPITTIEAEVELTVSEDGKTARGTVRADGPISSAWRYVFSLFVQSSRAVDPNWTLSVSNPPTQAQVQAIADQVSLLSQAVGHN